MHFTGERVIPGIAEIDELFQQHLARYQFASQYCSGRHVLDAGCGTGYGAALLAAAGARVVAVDRAADAVSYARATYGSCGVAFLLADCTALPFASSSFDLVVALEVIEHLEPAAGFLNHVHRLLRPGGIFIASTPNAAAQPPDAQPNPFHVREFSADELRACLRSAFPVVQVLNQSPSRAQVIAPAGGPAGHLSLPVLPVQQTTRAVAAELPSAEPEFLVALCAQRPSDLPPIEPFYFRVPPESHALPAYARHLQEEITAKDQHILHLEEEHHRLEGLLHEKEHRMGLLESACADLERLVGEKQAHALQLEAWCQELRSELDKRDEHLRGVARYHEQLQALLAAKDAHVSQVEEWCGDLQRSLQQEQDNVHNLARQRPEPEAHLLSAEASLAWASSYQRYVRGHLRHLPEPPRSTRPRPTSRKSAARRGRLPRS